MIPETFRKVIIMKKFIIATLFIPVLLTAATTTTDPAKSKYPLADKTAIQNAPENYYKKSISLKTVFLATSPSMPYFIGRTFSSKKYYMLIIQPTSFRVLAKKGKTFDSLIPTLKKMTPLILYGKVKRYSSKKHHSGISQYYLMLDKMEIDKEAQAAVKTKKEAQELKQEVKKETRHERHVRMLNRKVKGRWKKRPNVLTD
jgi:hypothetical protein